MRFNEPRTLAGYFREAVGEFALRRSFNACRINQNFLPSTIFLDNGNAAPAESRVYREDLHVHKCSTGGWYDGGMKSTALRSALFLRNLVFGVEDGLVSTVGLLSGIAIAGVGRETILLTGVVLIFVEAFSMAAGSFLSEASVEEMDGGEDDTRGSIAAGAIMFAAYFFAGLIPLLPYLIFEEARAFSASIFCSVLALLLLGYWSGRKTKSAWHKAIRMALVGGLAILVGVFAGSLLT